MANRILLAIDDNLGYSPDQVENTMTIADLISALEEAASDFGEDALIVLDNGQRYGAQYGGLNRWRDLLSPVEADDEDDSLSL